MTKKKAFADSVSRKPRVTIDEHGVIDIAGLMAAMIVEEAVREATAELRGEPSHGQATSNLHPDDPPKDLD